MLPPSLLAVAARSSAVVPRGACGGRLSLESGTVSTPAAAGLSIPSSSCKKRVGRLYRNPHICSKVFCRLDLGYAAGKGRALRTQ